VAGRPLHKWLPWSCCPNIVVALCCCQYCRRLPLPLPPPASHQVLENVVKTRWGALPDAQREGIKTYCSNLIIKISTDERAFRTERTFLSKLNLVGGCGQAGG